VIGSTEVASGIPDDRDIEFLQCTEDILSEAILVRQRVTGVIDAAVDASAHVSSKKILVHCSVPAEYSKQ
jgi:hypothetical protein